MASNAYRTSGGNYVAEASDFGFRAGAPMPDTITTDGIRFNYSRTRRDVEGEIVAWDYTSQGNVRLVVFND